jgi:O-6-methylguanine DNA methyltransferase
MLKLDSSGLSIFNTRVGPVGMVWTPRGVSSLVFGEATEGLAAAYPDIPKKARPNGAAGAIVKRIKAHLRGKLDDFRDVPVDFGEGSDYAIQVLKALRRVGPGKVVTYGELAKKTGRPGASRAVGRIMGANPVPLIVPCHRCMGADGSLTGFSAEGGQFLKAWLLHIEGYERNSEHAAGLRHLAKVDRKMRRVIDLVGPYQAVPDKPVPHWETLVTAIVHQQLSVKAGQTIAGRVRALTPGPRYPEPAQMAAVQPITLRNCGLSNAKVSYVQDLAARVDDGRLNLASLSRKSDAEVIEELTKVRGIGEWSAHMYLIFRLGRLDILATGDLGLRMGAGKMYGLEEHATPAELTEIAEPWRPYRSIGSWYLWRALDSGGLKD